MPNPHNSNWMFKLSHRALVIWAEACVNGLAMLSAPPNNEEFCLEVEKGLIQDKDKPKEDVIGLNFHSPSSQFMVNPITPQPQLKLSSGGNPPVFGGFINKDTDTKSDSSKSSSDIKVINQTVYQFETFLTDAGMFDLECLDLEPETAQNLAFQA
ncbi:hypothetical protein CROQUDRAFT_87767 [Cronartium quercuum f. sp. fusiforme G11]|uniref:Uncharacterized protein n=1 Tax=Cronartium quercuum f. sp. fusiforme G11 TaxID=708437 RepID=A0A9P6NNW5_9BASI|nr:hypothetical protein CROQUDRAFT_87767 [Cronartium quercuum f. sp. fusiforme G11]